MNSKNQMTKQAPTQQELLRLFQKRNVLQFDETPVLRASVNDISQTKVNDYLVRLGQGPLDQENARMLARDLINLSVMTDIDDVPRPTLGGMLAFGKQPQRYFPGYMVLCGAYRGIDTVGEATSEKNITGTLDRLIEDTLSFCRRVIPQDSRLLHGVKRSDAYRFPIEALREGVVNAVCHRDYTVSGSSIRVFIFSDRIEIRSPGGLPNTLTLESMVYRQFARNQILASYLSGMGYMERRGKGILRIRKICEENGITSRFELTPDNSEFVLTMISA